MGEDPPSHQELVCVWVGLVAEVMIYLLGTGIVDPGLNEGGETHPHCPGHYHIHNPAPCQWCEAEYWGREDALPCKRPSPSSEVDSWCKDNASLARSHRCMEAAHKP